VRNNMDVATIVGIAPGKTAAILSGEFATF
jgi:hypothetical protein